MLKIFIIFVFLTSSIFAFEKVYFLPNDTNIAQKDILHYINNATSSIDLAMYNINYKKFIKALNKATKRGVKVNIYYYKKKAKFKNGIKIYKIKTKLHTKIAIFDKKIVEFGSANWKKESFKQNYEVIYITDKKDILTKFNNFITTLKR
jgi:phosphatidylserine/phosphatidylglycerophosphate/cardiolipin synthase-like enzyme